MDKFGNTRRIDRLIIKKDEAWVVDYKSSRLESEKGKKQLQEYMGLVSQIYPGLRVRGYLVFLDSFDLLEIPLPNPPPAEGRELVVFYMLPLPLWEGIEEGE